MFIPSKCPLLATETSHRHQFPPAPPLKDEQAAFPNIQAILLAVVPKEQVLLLTGGPGLSPRKLLPFAVPIKLLTVVGQSLRPVQRILIVELSADKLVRTCVTPVLLAKLTKPGTVIVVKILTTVIITRSLTSTNFPCPPLIAPRIVPPTLRTFFTQKNRQTINGIPLPTIFSTITKNVHRKQVDNKLTRSKNISLSFDLALLLLDWVLTR